MSQGCDQIARAMDAQWSARDGIVRSRRNPQALTRWPSEVERVTGIEPAFSAWEADVLPLNYTRGAAGA
jgi:hypothetical protein